MILKFILDIFTTSVSRWTSASAYKESSWKATEAAKKDLTKYRPKILSSICASYQSICLININRNLMKIMKNQLSISSSFSHAFHSPWLKFSVYDSYHFPNFCLSIALSMLSKLQSSRMSQQVWFRSRHLIIGSLSAEGCQGMNRYHAIIVFKITLRYFASADYLYRYSRAYGINV